MERDSYTLAVAQHVSIAILGQDAIVLDLEQQQKDRQYVLIKKGALLFPALLAGRFGEDESPSRLEPDPQRAAPPVRAV